MTKTTNFEVSKKLAEIGFEPHFYYCWRIKDKTLWYYSYHFHERGESLSNYYPSFFLDEILEVLPCGLNQGNERYNLTILQNTFMWYANKDAYRDDYICDNGGVMASTWANDESLADMAGRL